MVSPSDIAIWVQKNPGLLDDNPELLGYVQKDTNKYHNRISLVDGITFRSGHEADVDRQLQLLLRNDEALVVRRQAPIYLTESRGRAQKVTYVADWLWVDKELKVHLWDAKGARTKEFITKKKLVMDQYGIEIEEV